MPQATYRRMTATVSSASVISAAAVSKGFSGLDGCRVRAPVRSGKATLAMEGVAVQAVAFGVGQVVLCPDLEGW